MSTFTNIPVGGFFTISGERFKKTGPMTYMSLENPILGEYTIQPITEKNIKYTAPVVPAPTPVVTTKAKKTKKPTKRVAVKSGRRGK
jgi:hypothetical protein